MLKAIKEFFTGKKSEPVQAELGTPVPYKVEAPVPAEPIKVETVITAVSAADVPVVSPVVATPAPATKKPAPAKKPPATKKPAPAKKSAPAKKPATSAITSAPKTSNKKK